MYTATMLLLWLLSLSLQAQEVPTFELRGRESGVELPPALLAAFSEVLAVGEPDDQPLVITASRRPPALSMPQVISPHSLGLETRPQEQGFLLELTKLLPMESIDPRTAGQLADRLYSAGSEAAVEARGPWMASALPLYRVAAEGEVRHPDRLGLRIAWAARLGGGTRDDLALAEALVVSSEDSAWSREARMVLADAWMQPVTWDNMADAPGP